MADDTPATPAEPVAPSGAAVPAQPVAPIPTEPITVADQDSDNAVVGTTIGADAVRSEEAVNELASAQVGAEQHDIERSYQEIEAAEAAHDLQPGPTDGAHVGLLHSDTVYRPRPIFGNEGPGQEQIHTNL